MLLDESKICIGQVKKAMAVTTLGFPSRPD
jgi:hypothetical protein